MQDTLPRIFISYSSADRQEAQKILDLLGAAGLGSWFDDLNISGGAMWSSSIVEAIKQCSAMILLCTPSSVSSRNVHQEIQLAWEHNRPILPLILEASPLDPKIEYALAGRQYISVTNVGQEIWLPKVLRALHECGVELDRKILARIGNMNAPSSEPDIDFLPPPTNLSHSVSETIGREKELAELEQRISNARIVTLTGTGGTGKTRLSIDTGRQVLSRFKGGVYFVPLAPIIEPALVASAIAQSLDIREVQGQPLIASIKAFIYKKHLLLILDNFEHLLSARHTVSELLESCPNLKIIITSRIHLGVRGENEYHVEPLRLPSRTATKEELSASPAAQLFIQRAKESRFNFEVTPDDVEPINKICHKLDGLPLAIELAASRIRMFNTQTILTRLEEWRSFLSSGSADQPERHKTLYNAIEWSYNLLRQEERSLFNIL
ncbi:MAG TPA: TIR domain-containing protein, partial [Candidatus Kapabacteria bacterium]